MDFSQIVEATPEYFESIRSMLDTYVGEGHELFDVVRMDVGFLETFSKWLEAWDDTTSVDEESMENLRCIVTSLKLIWPKEFKALSLLNVNGPMFDDLEMKDIHSAVFELEAKIQQTKGQVECWNQILMRSSLQFNYSTFEVLFRLLDGLKRRNGNEFSHILETKIQFVRDSLLGVDFKKLPFLNLIDDFAKSATCLTCLYWAKESKAESATEMIGSLFDMSQKFVPFSSDITTWYTDFLKSYRVVSFAPKIPTSSSHNRLPFQFTIFNDRHLFEKLIGCMKS